MATAPRNPNELGFFASNSQEHSSNSQESQWHARNGGKKTLASNASSLSAENARLVTTRAWKNVASYSADRMLAAMQQRDQQQAADNHATQSPSI